MVTTKIAITNVRIFDGNRIREPSTVFLDGKKIIEDATDAIEVDGRGGVLLPGLIDAHVHLLDPCDLEELSKYGVTTAIDMATRPTNLKSLRGRHGVTDMRSAGLPATAPGSSHSRMMMLPTEALVAAPEQAAKFVADRIAEGSDFIKVVADIPGPSQASLNALSIAAHEQGKLVVAHAATSVTIAMAQEAKVDCITHSPLDQSMDYDAVALMVAEKRFSIPTLTMMEGVANLRKPQNPEFDYAHARDTVTAQYRAGVPILAGTDANKSPGSPCKVAHGSSLHHELELLVEAGLSALDALRAATSLPAKYFNLVDRGIIRPGYRADLVLLARDPVNDIRATRSILRVWIAGVECLPAAAA